MPSNSDSFHLIEGDLVTGAIVKLGGPGAFMGSHRLRVFERATGLEIGGDPSRGNTWQPSLPFSPASAVRRRTIWYASTRCIASSVKRPVLPAAERKRGVLP